MNAKTQDRQRLIRLIHVAKRDLALDDDSYRAILRRIGTKESAADLAVPELEKVLEHMKRSGFKVRSRNSRLSLAADPQSKMIRGLWLELAGMGVVRNPSESALRTFVAQMTGIDLMKWLSTEQASQVIEHLKEWRERVIRSRRTRLVEAMHLALPAGIEAVAAEEEQLRDTADRVLGRRAGVGDMTETEFQKVLQQCTREMT
ncbi:gp16 family protein [Laribacter hongkongensis]|uniref:gp16 family protein n=1 Tax=Laribacter hongkongensis TaxID=168471 RepID=UPI001EFEE7C7|nr:regulatory protein GemA [Laribacter hongkongensis]MCG9079436.1 regulatory protein GemA [Laribacter hongkongensis]